jgi:glutamate-1-semialdehyde 2,1-aminomutase
MNQAELLAKARRYLPGGCLGMMPLPDDIHPVLVRGQGSRVYDANGKEYLDYMLGSGPMLLGHGRPEVVEAVQRQAALGSTFFALTEPAVQLAEQLVEAAPCGEAMRFQTTGSEATFAALRLARAFTGRDKTLKFEGGWHGSHDVGQLSGAPSKPAAFPQAVPDCDGITLSAAREVLVAPFNDLDTTAALIERHHAEIASVIVEPLQRALKPAPGFLEGLRELTRRHGIVLLFDEIVTGFRLAWGGAQERYGVVPDVACYGKAMAGGYALSAVVGRREILELANPLQKGRGKYCFLSGTLTANPVACAAGLAALGVLRQPGVFEHLHRVSQRLAQGLRRAGEKAGIPLQVLGDGPVLQVYFTDNRPLLNHRDLLCADRALAVRFGYELIRRGVFCAPGGKLYLSLAHSDADIDQTIDIASNALHALSDGHASAAEGRGCQVMTRGPLSLD